MQVLGSSPFYFILALSQNSDLFPDLDLCRKINFLSQNLDKKSELKRIFIFGHSHLMCDQNIWIDKVHFLNGD